MVWKWLFGKKETETAQPRVPVSRPEKGWVSVWVADFTDELDLDGYSNREFSRDHGVAAFDDGSYVIVEEARSIGELLRRFHRSEGWAGRAAAACRERGIQKASCAVIREDYLHQPLATGAGPLRFGGCIRTRVNDIEAGRGWVSVWIGTSTASAEYLQDCSSEAFARAHALQSFDGAESTIKTSAVPIEQLLEGFSMKELWAKEAAAQCRKKGIEQACCAAVLFHHRQSDGEEGSPLELAACVRMRGP